VRRVGLAIFAAAALVAAAPAWSGDDGKAPPVAELTVSPQQLVAGEPAALDASASRDADGSVASYAWDLDGDGAFERQSGTEATLAHAFEQAGEHSVAVRVVDDSGDSADARTTVAVAEPPAAEPEPVAEPPAAEPEPETKATAPEPAAPAQRPKAEAKERKPPAAAEDAEQPDTSLQAAASRTVSIRDFSFAPKSVSVSVGDTVTWNNTGDEVHTATARDGSFDTGNIASGGSGSATFRKAGTFSYFCKPHAFMTASVTVTGSGSGGGGGSGGGTQGATGTGDDGAAGDGTAADGDDLPSTGLSLAPFLLTGLAMIGSGVALRRRCAKTAV
jgi:plastocyanin